MFQFNAQAPAATTATTTALNPTFTFTPANTSQPWNPFGNPPTSTPMVNFTATGFGTNPTATGTTFKFNPVSGQGPFPATITTTSNIFGSNTTTTTMTNLPATSFRSFTFRPNTTPTTNIFGTSTSTTPNPFGIMPITTQSPPMFPVNTNPTVPFVFGPQTTANTSIFSPSITTTSASGIPPTPITNIFGVPITTTTSAAPVVTNSTTTTTTPFVFGPQPTANTSIFSPSITTTSASGIAPIPITNIFGVPIITTTSTTSAVSNSIIQSTAGNIFGTNTLTTTMPQVFNPPLFTGLPVAQSQPAVTSSSSIQELNPSKSISIVQERFLAASLLDPYANRGKKDFTNIDQIPVSTESTVVSTSSTTINTTPIPVTLPIQSNTRRVSSARSVVDVNFKLKPASSLSSLNDDIKPSNQQLTTSMGQKKSALGGSFTDEEELVLLGQTKMSKLRLSSNDVINSTQQSDPIRSLYPLRRLADLEKLNNITPPSSPTITRKVNNERSSTPESRDVSPNHHSNPTNIAKQSSSPRIQPKSIYNSQTHCLPILTRDNYYMKPTISELKSLFNDKSQCILKQFTVGHEKYGSVTFYGEINVAGLNLDEIIEIKQHEVIVYPDDNNKPSVGEELNVPARITLFGVYPIDRSTREQITDIERIKAANYNDHLREITKKFDGEFINYGIQDGSWTFMVKHFTRYGLDHDANFTD